MTQGIIYFEVSNVENGIFINYLLLISLIINQWCKHSLLKIWEQLESAKDFSEQNVPHH